MTPFLECLRVGCLIYVFAPFLYYSFNDVMSMPARRDGIRGDKRGGGLLWENGKRTDQGRFVLGTM